MVRIGDYDVPRCYRCGAELAFLPAEGREKPVMCEAGTVPFWPGREVQLLTPDGKIVWGRLRGRPEEIIGAGNVLHAQVCPGRKGATRWAK